MSQYPGFIRRLLSTTVLGYFDSYDDPVALAELWPMNGDREWAGRCVEWINRYRSTANAEGISTSRFFGLA